MTTEDISNLTPSIDENTGGCWQVTTESGTTYLLDLDARELVRTPRISGLRCDGEAVSLHQVMECTVAQGAMFLIQVRDDDIPAIQITTTIVQIRRRRHDCAEAIPR